MSKEIVFRKETLTVEIGKYRQNNRKSITLMTKKGEPFMVASVNINELDVAENEVLIKNYSENEGIYEALMEANVIKKAKQIYQTTFAEFHLCEFK